MAAYWLSRCLVRDPVQYKKYTDRVPAIVAAHGGKVLARGGRYQIMEGPETFHRFVVIEFPTLEAGVRQRLPLGGELSVSARQAQRSSNVLAKSAPPVTLEVNAGLVLSFKQPLLRGAGVGVTETDKRVSEIESLVAQWQYLQQLHKVLAEGLSLFWQAEVASQATRWREQLLAGTESLVQDARVRIEAGKLAPRANLELARVLLAREADLGRAVQTRDELKLRLLSSLDLEATELPGLQLDGQSAPPNVPTSTVDAALAQGLGKMAHGAEKQRDLLRMVGYVVGFGGHFGQQHGVLGWVQIAQRGQVKGQLVPEHQRQAPAGRHHWHARLIGTRRRCCGPAAKPHISSWTTAWIR